MCKRLFTGALCLLAVLPVFAAQEQIIIDGVAYRDPTQPYGVTRQGPLVQQQFVPNRVYAVRFIRSGISDSVALVNNVLVRQGDTIDGAQVIEINTDSVSLKLADEVLVIKAFSEIEPKQFAR